MLEILVALRLPDSCWNWNLKMLVFEERGKPEYPEKNVSEQGSGFDAGISVRATLVGGASALTAPPSLLPKLIIN